jgi:cytochrome c-type biogenesis protein CcmH
MGPVTEGKALMGWVFALGFAALCMIGLALSGRLNGPALQIAGAALLLALAGYGWQGSPGMAGTPVQHNSR